MLDFINTIGLSVKFKHSKTISFQVYAQLIQIYLSIYDEN